MTAQPSKLVDRIGAFVAVPFSLARAGHISGNSKAVFLLLRSYPSSNDSGVAFPSYESIREHCGFASNATAAKCLRELETHGWIVRSKRFGSTTVYTLQIGSPPASPTESVILPVRQKVSHSPTESVAQSDRKCRRVRLSSTKTKNKSDGEVPASRPDASPSAPVEPAQPATPKPLTEQQINFQFLQDVCVANYGASVLGKFAAELTNAGATDAQREKFRTWWAKVDFRGKQGQPPTPMLVWQQWPVAQAWKSPADDPGPDIGEFIGDRLVFKDGRVIELEPAQPVDMSWKKKVTY